MSDKQDRKSLFVFPYDRPRWKEIERLIYGR